MNQSRPQVVLSDDPSHIGPRAAFSDVERLLVAMRSAIPHADVYVRPLRVPFTAPIRMRAQVERVIAKVAP